MNESTGLEPRDIDRARKLVHVRDNRFRSFRKGGIKYRVSVRSVPLWPDVLEWLPARIGHGPLFPAPTNPAEPVRVAATEPNCFLARIIERVMKACPSLKDKRFTPHVGRHTWCAMRLQMVDGGEPISMFTVMKEGGWNSLRMVEKVYGHLPAKRHRLSVLTYRPEALKVAAAGD